MREALEEALEKQEAELASFQEQSAAELQAVAIKLQEAVSRGSKLQGVVEVLETEVAGLIGERDAVRQAEAEAREARASLEEQLAATVAGPANVTTTAPDGFGVSDLRRGLALAESQLATARQRLQNVALEVGRLFSLLGIETRVVRIERDVGKALGLELIDEGTRCTICALQPGGAAEAGAFM